MKSILLYLTLIIGLAAHPAAADLIDPNASVTLYWNDTSDAVDPNTGGTATLTVTGPTVGPMTIVNGNEGSTYGRTNPTSSLTDFGISFYSTSDVPAINPAGGLAPIGYAPSGVSAYLVEPGTTNQVSDWGYIFQMTKEPVYVGVNQPTVYLYTIHGLFQSDPVEGAPDNGIPMTVPTGFTGIPETGTAQEVTSNYQFQDFSNSPYPVVTVTLPSNLHIIMASDSENGGGNGQGVPDQVNTAVLLALALVTLRFSRSRLIGLAGCR